MGDFVIRRAKIVDGSGEAARVGDVGVIGEKIRLSGLPDTLPELDGLGLTLTPGFIDSHSHSDLCMGADPAAAFMGKITQGVTTEICGQCGDSLFPVRPDRVSSVLNGAGSLISPRNAARLARFESFERFLAETKADPKYANCAFLVGHNTLRASVMGTEDRPATAEELEEMKRLLRLCMEQGAAGLSSGLVYIPGAYADDQELTELAKVIAPFGGVYATHMRDEADDCPRSVADSIAVAERSGAALVISHHKICGQRNWGLSRQTLALVDAAAARGVNVHMDMYPYRATMTTLDNCLPPEAFSGGLERLADMIRDKAGRAALKERMASDPCGYDNPYRNAGGFGGVLVSFAAVTKEAQGRTVAQLAQEQGRDPFDVYFDLLLKNHFRVTATYFSLSEEEMLNIYRHPRSVIGSDALCSETPSPTHPRGYGSFIKPLADFALRRHIVTLEEAVHKQTGLTAKVWGIRNKGLIREGFDADLVLLDESELEDRADFRDGTRPCRGVRTVIVNGAVAFDRGQPTGMYAGRPLLRRNGQLCMP